MKEKLSTLKKKLKQNLFYKEQSKGLISTFFLIFDIKSTIINNQ